MSLDDRIKRELEGEAEKLDEILNDTQGMFDLAVIPFRGGLGKWMILVTVIALIVSGFMVWSGYKFWIADSIDKRVFWGVWLVVTLTIQIGLKQWAWMETNRCSLLREVKRVEIAVAKLTSDTSVREVMIELREPEN